MNDSTLAFNFTRNSLQVHEDLLTAVRPVGMEMCVYGPSNWAILLNHTVKGWQDGQLLKKKQTSITRFQLTSFKKTALWKPQEPHRMEPLRHIHRSPEALTYFYPLCDGRSHGNSPAAVCGVESPHTHGTIDGLSLEFPALFKCWWWVTYAIAAGQSKSWLEFRHRVEASRALPSARPQDTLPRTCPPAEGQKPQGYLKPDISDHLTILLFNPQGRMCFTWLLKKKKKKSDSNDQILEPDSS